MTGGSLPFAFTIAEVADEGLIAAKRIGRNPDGTIWKSHYDHATWWRFAPTECASIEAMAARLWPLAMQPRKCVLMGAPVAGLDLSAVHRRRWADPKDATLRAVDRSWIVLDCDDVIVPAGLGRADRLADAALYVRDRLAPPEFRDVRMIAIPSASTGLQGDAIARLKLFAALDRAWPLETLRAWVMGARVCDALPLDPAVVQAGQPVYTARPVFIGMNDPVPASCRAIILPGSADTVSLIVDRYVAKTVAIRARVKGAATACGRNWKQLLALTVGGDTGFFEPLSKGIGAAVRAGASAIEIEGFVAALLAQRADPGRRRQYGQAWVSRSIRSFHRRDAAARAAGLNNFSMLEPRRHDRHDRHRRNRRDRHRDAIQMAKTPMLTARRPRCAPEFKRSAPTPSPRLREARTSGVRAFAHSATGRRLST